MSDIFSGNEKGEEFVMSDPGAFETDSAEARLAIAVLYENLGKKSRDDGDTEAARDYYLRSLALHETVNLEVGTTDTLRKLMLAYDTFVRFCLDVGDIRSAGEYYRVGREKIGPLVKKSETCVGFMDMSLESFITLEFEIPEE